MSEQLGVPGGAQLGDVIPELDGLVGMEAVASGGFSVIYRAFQPALNRTVALKIMSADGVDRRDRERFSREMGLTGKLGTHPNIVDVYQHGLTKHGQPYLMMPWYEGGSLADGLRDSGPMPPPVLLRLAIKMASALGYAHQHGVLHRDVKPGNILLTALNEPVLADFGIAVDARHAGNATVAWTPNHAAPEVLSYEEPTAQSDLWALASTLYTALAGRPPYPVDPGNTLLSIQQRFRSAPPPFVRRDVPQSLTDALVQALAPAPENRPRDMAEFIAGLQMVERELDLPVTVPPGLAPVREARPYSGRAHPEPDTLVPDRPGNPNGSGGPGATPSGGSSWEDESGYGGALGAAHGFGAGAGGAGVGGRGNAGAGGTGVGGPGYTGSGGSGGAGAGGRGDTGPGGAGAGVPGYTGPGGNSRSVGTGGFGSAGGVGGENEAAGSPGARGERGSNGGPATGYERNRGQDNGRGAATGQGSGESGGPGNRSWESESSRPTGGSRMGGSNGAQAFGATGQLGGGPAHDGFTGAQQRGRSGSDGLVGHHLSGPQTPHRQNGSGRPGLASVEGWAPEDSWESETSWPGMPSNSNGAPAQPRAPQFNAILPSEGTQIPDGVTVVVGGRQPRKQGWSWKRRLLTSTIGGLLTVAAVLIGLSLTAPGNEKDDPEPQETVEFVPPTVSGLRVSERTPTSLTIAWHSQGPYENAHRVVIEKGETIWLEPEQIQAGSAVLTNLEPRTKYCLTVDVYYRAPQATEADPEYAVSSSERKCFSTRK